MRRRILTFEGMLNDRMFITSLKAADMVIHQPVKLSYDIWMVVHQGGVRVAPIWPSQT